MFVALTRMMKIFSDFLEEVRRPLDCDKGEVVKEILLVSGVGSMNRKAQRASHKYLS